MAHCRTQQEKENEKERKGVSNYLASLHYNDRREEETTSSRINSGPQRKEQKDGDPSGRQPRWPAREGGQSMRRAIIGEPPPPPPHFPSTAIGTRGPTRIHLVRSSEPRSPRIRSGLLVRPKPHVPSSLVQRHLSVLSLQFLSFGVPCLSHPYCLALDV